jgi:hypothetical protein
MKSRTKGEVEGAVNKATGNLQAKVPEAIIAETGERGTNNCRAALKPGLQMPFQSHPIMTAWISKKASRGSKRWRDLWRRCY